MSGGYGGGGSRRGGSRGWLTLPELKSRDFGRLGPAFGYGIGCGAGFGLGFIGGLGLGAGFPGFQFGVGLGAGCGVGIGFGYGTGKGVAYDKNGRYSNVGKFLQRGQRSSSSQDEVDELVNEVLENTRRLLKAASREIDKWRWS